MYSSDLWQEAVMSSKATKATKRKANGLPSSSATVPTPPLTSDNDGTSRATSSEMDVDTVSDDEEQVVRAGKRVSLIFGQDDREIWPT